MKLWKPSRREFIAAAPLALGSIRASAQILSRSPHLRFLVVGDWGRDGTQNQDTVARWMNYHACTDGCDFVVSTGDNFYTFGVSGVDDPKWETSFENVYSRELRSVPWFPVAGNHDWGGNIWAQLDRTGRGGWHMPWLFYDIPGARFGRPDIHFFFVDTIVWNRDEGFYKRCGQSIRMSDADEQDAWLPSALSRSKASIKIVFGHYPIYSVGKHGGTKKMETLDKVLRENGVSAYVCGHDHCLYHIQSKGLDYICSGGGSQEMAAYTGGSTSGCVLPTQCEKPLEPVWYKFIPGAGFAIFEVGLHDLSFEFIDRFGGRFGRTPIAIRPSKQPPGSGVPTLDPAVLTARAHARAKSAFPCSKIPDSIVSLFAPLID